MSTLALVLIVLLLVGAIGGLPQFGLHSYNYAPVSIVTVILVIILILALTGRL